MSKARRTPVLPSIIATAIALLLQGAARALLSTNSAVAVSVQSTISASNRCRVSFCIALSASEQCSTAISRSLSTRRNIRRILSSEQSKSAFRVINALSSWENRTLKLAAACGGAHSFFFFGFEQVRDASQLFRRLLQGFDLLA